MRVACIIHSLDGGGAERVMALLCSQLASRGHDVVLVTLDDGGCERRKVDPAVTRLRLDVLTESNGLISRFQGARLRVKRLRESLVGLAPDIVLSFCDRTNILTLMAASGTGLPVIISERSDPSQQHLGKVWEWLRNKFYPQSAKMIALTDTVADYLSLRFNVPVAVIPSAIDAPVEFSNREAAIEQKRIVAVGRLEHEKGFDRLIDAFSQLSGEHDPWSLRLVGEGSHRDQLCRQVETLRLEHRVSIPGWIQPIEDELRLATIFALPSRYEGFPSALMEAMALGVPSVAVDCESGPRAVIRDPEWALLVPNDVESLRQGLSRMIVDHDFREQLGQSGRAVAEAFSWEAMTDRYESILRLAVEQHQRDD